LSWAIIDSPSGRKCADWFHLPQVAQAGGRLIQSGFLKQAQWNNRYRSAGRTASRKKSRPVDTTVFLSAALKLPPIRAGVASAFVAADH
jgi:hypothetical protein